MASATSAARSDSRDSRTHTQGNPDKSAEAGGPSKACDSGSCKVVLPQPHTDVQAKAETAGLQPAGQACRGLEHSLASSAGTKQSAGVDCTAMPQSYGEADFAEKPQRDAHPPRKFAKLSRSMLSRRKTERPVSKPGSVPAAAAAAKQHLSAGSSIQDMASKERSAVLQCTGKAHSMPSTATAAKCHLSTGMGAQDAASQEQRALSAFHDKALSRNSIASRPPSKPEQSLRSVADSIQPASLKTLPTGGETKQANSYRGQPGSGKDAPQSSEDIKPAAYLSGALGHLLATR